MYIEMLGFHLLRSLLRDREEDMKRILENYEIWL